MSVCSSEPSCTLKAGTNDDLFIVGAQDGAEPDRGIGFKPDLADDLRVWRDPKPAITRHDGRNAIERVKWHPSRPLAHDRLNLKRLRSLYLCFVA
jgi:hypothetical protein